MITVNNSRFSEQAGDVLASALGSLSRNIPVALVTVTQTTGGGLRSVGSLIAVNLEGEMTGYVSNGCVDTEVIKQAQLAIEEGTNRSVLYGVGSPFFDIVLPCGGTVELLIFPVSDSTPIKDAIQTLVQRQCATLVFDTIKNTLSRSGKNTEKGWIATSFYVLCTPKIRLRIAGEGASFMAVASLGLGSGFEVIAQSPNEFELSQLESQGSILSQKLSTPSSTPDCIDDQFTAFLLLFHDHEWETELLKKALTKNAFFIGAMGSKSTHEQRIQTLSKSGIGALELSRIESPLGLIPSLRNAKQIAISALAQVISCITSPAS